MNRLGYIALALLFALVYASPAFGSNLQSTDALDQRLDQGRASALLLTGSNTSPDAASERCAACATATVVHNTGCELHADQIADALGDGATIRRAESTGPFPKFDADLPTNKKDGGWAYHDYVVDADGRAWDADTPGMPVDEYEALFPDWINHGPRR